MLDMSTVYYAAATVLVGFSATLGVLWLSDRRRSELLSFSIAILLIAGGNLLVPLRGVLPSYIAIIGSNGLICAGVLAVWRGCRLMTGLPPRPVTEAVLLASLLIALAWFLYATPSVNARIVAGSLFIAALDAALCREAGMNDHMTKPIDRAGLANAVAKWRGAKSTSRLYPRK